MAATFVVEDGTGKTDANSFTTVAFADQFHENYLATPTDWTGEAEDDKKLWLRLATQAIENWFRERWPGTKTNSDQATAWPRTSVSVDDHSVASTTMPVQLQEATSYLANKAKTITLVPDVVTPGEIKRKMTKAGPVTQDITYVGGGALQAKEYTLVEGMLRSLLRSGTSFERS